MTATVLVATIALQGAPPPGRPCVAVIDSIGGNYRETPAGPGLKNTFGGGGVAMHCQGTRTSVAADSFAHFGGPNRIDLVGHVRIRDTTLTLDAANASYFLRDERLEAHKDVVTINRRTGSVLRGPNLTYLRAVPGIRDTTEMVASGRPTIDYRSASDSSGEPYVIVGDRVRFKGDDRFWGGGHVTIDRSDFTARGDSVMLDEQSGLGLLLGSANSNPRIEGKGADHYALVGRRIELVLERREVNVARALGTGEATSADWHLTGDTIVLTLAQRKVEHVNAWGEKGRPLAVSAKTTVRADSLALDTPAQVLEELRAFGKAHATQARDSTADSTVGDDWMTGDTLVAHFERADSAGKPRAELRRLLARGSARSLMHLRKSGEQPCWSRNYSRGEKIDVAMKGDSVEQVVVSGHADGVQLECFVARAEPDSAARDSTPPTVPAPAPPARPLQRTP
jgi:hypothetical protein